MSNSPLANAVLGMLPLYPEHVVTMLSGVTVAACDDEPLLAAYGTALAKTGREPDAFVVFERLGKLRPDDVDVFCAIAESAMASMNPVAAIAALERCFALDATMNSKGGRRARLLAVKLEKRLSA